MATRRKHPFGPAGAKVEKQAVTAEKIKVRLQAALKKLAPTTSDSNPDAETPRRKT